MAIFKKKKKKNIRKDTKMPQLSARGFVGPLGEPGEGMPNADVMPTAALSWSGSAGRRV